MPGPLKDNPKNTTGLKLTKAGGKRARVDSTLPAVQPSFGSAQADKYLSDLRDQLEALTELVQQHEQKLNRMQVDGSGIVSFVP